MIQDSPPDSTSNLDALQARQKQSGPLDRQSRDQALATLERMLHEQGDAFSEAIGRDFRFRSRHETRLLEIFPSLENIRHARRHLRRWMRPQRRAPLRRVTPAARCKPKCRDSLTNSKRVAPVPRRRVHHRIAA